MRNIACIGIIAMALVAGCNEHQRYAVPESDTEIAGGENLSTFSHDGHLWVVYDGYRAGGLSHHPDCPCINKGDYSYEK